MINRYCPKHKERLMGKKHGKDIKIFLKRQKAKKGPGQI